MLARALVLLCVAMTVAGCDSDPVVSYPSEAKVDVGHRAIEHLSADDRYVLLQYFSGHPNWVVLVFNGNRYAIRKRVNRNRYPIRFLSQLVIPADHTADSLVIVAFGAPAPPWRGKPAVTRLWPGSLAQPVAIQTRTPERPGCTSYVIVEGDGISIEMYERRPEAKRVFTEATYAHVSDEIESVLANRELLKAHGRIPDCPSGPAWLSPEPSMEITDGSQPGIYRLKASVAPSSFGFVEVRVRAHRTGRLLSADRISECTRRFVGWSTGGATTFPYEVEFTVYEGDFDTVHDVDIQLWHVAGDGTETKLNEVRRKVNGWQR